MIFWLGIIALGSIIPLAYLMRHRREQSLKEYFKNKDGSFDEKAWINFRNRMRLYS